MTQAEIIQKIIAGANNAGIDANIAIEQARQESGFNPNATSYAGAQGLFQFMPGTWAAYGSGSPFDVDNSIAAWARYMGKLLRQFGGRYDLALAGYNSGENRAEYKSAAQQNRAINWASLPAGVQSQTQDYILRILSRAGKPPNFIKALKVTLSAPKSTITACCF
jgi:soluble lytic murein transglycosylase-like protein